MNTVLSIVWLAAQPVEGDRRPTLQLPDPESTAHWALPARQAGFRVATRPVNDGARVRLVTESDGLAVWAIDGQGRASHTRVPQPTNAEERTAVLAVAASLVRTSHWQVPAPVSRPKQAPDAPAPRFVVRSMPSPRTARPLLPPVTAPRQPVRHTFTPDRSAWRISWSTGLAATPATQSTGTTGQLRVGHGHHMRSHLTAHVGRMIDEDNTQTEQGLGTGLTWTAPAPLELGIWASAASLTQTGTCGAACSQTRPTARLAASVAWRHHLSARTSVAPELSVQQRLHAPTSTALQLSVDLARTVRRP